MPPGTLLAEPMHDTKTGRFAKGNQAHRLRLLKTNARHLIGLNPEKVVPWLRPWVALASADASRLVTENGIEGDTGLMRLAEDVAASHAVFRGLLALGAEGDRTALTEARTWLREHRQSLLTLRAEARVHAAQAPRSDPTWEAEALERVRKLREPQDGDQEEDNPEDAREGENDS